MNWGRVVVAVLLGEIVPILVLVGVIAIWGPADAGEVDLFAGRAGAWVGPIAGALTLFVVAYWAGVNSSRPLLQGTVIGVAVALTDFAILFSTGASFAWLFVVSNGGKVVAGMAGGWVVRTQSETRVER